MWSTARHGILNDDSKVYSLNTYSDTIDTMYRADIFESTADPFSSCVFEDICFPSYQDLNYSHTPEKLPDIIDSQKQRHDDTRDPPPISQTIR